jgi:hypothetical protein
MASASSSTGGRGEVAVSAPAVSGPLPGGASPAAWKAGCLAGCCAVLLVALVVGLLGVGMLRSLVRGAGVGLARPHRDGRASIVPRPDGERGELLSEPGRGLRHAVVDDRYLYFVRGAGSGTSILRVPKAGGDTWVLGETGSGIAGNVDGLAADGLRVWVAGWDGLYRLDRESGAKDRVAEGRVRAVAVEGGWVYFAGDEELRRLPTAGGPSRLLHRYPPQHDVNLGAGEGEVYLGLDASRQLLRLAADGGAVEVIDRGGLFRPGHPILVDAEHVYWVDAVLGLRRRPRAGGGDVGVPAAARGEGGSHHLGLAMDDGHLYWGRSVARGAQQVRDHRGTTRWIHTASGAGGLVRIDKRGGEPVNLLPGAGDVLGVAVDATHVYWLDSERGVVGRKAL